MNVLVTGAAGYIGSTLVYQLAAIVEDAAFASQSVFDLYNETNHIMELLFISTCYN